MASIRRQIVIDADPDAVWDALRDWDALHYRLAAGFVTDTHRDGTARIVTFGSGVTVREEILGCDEEHRRLAWSVVGGPYTHHNGAAEVLAEHGVAGTTLDDVRAAANVSKGQLYHYFADKEDLVHAVIDRTVQQVLDAQPRLIDLSSWAAIAAWFDDLVQLQADRHAVGGCPIGSLAGELAERDEQSRTELAAGFGRWEAPIREGLRQMQADGKLRRGADPARLATATLAAIQGGLVLSPDPPGPTTAPHRARRGIHLPALLRRLTTPSSTTLASRDLPRVSTVLLSPSFEPPNS